MYIVIEGTECTDLFTKYGCYETPRKVNGKNAGTALDGSQIVDLLTVKYDLTLAMKPMVPSELAFIQSILTQSTVSATYFSDIRNTYVTAEFVSELSAAKVGLVNGETKKLYPMTLTLKQV